MELLRFVYKNFCENKRLLIFIIMAEVTLKKKITLRRKEEQAAFTFSGKLKVKLMWSSSTDLDLWLFFLKNDGLIGGIFSYEYRGK